MSSSLPAYTIHDPEVVCPYAGPQITQITQTNKRICVICGLLFFAVIKSEAQAHPETPLARLVRPIRRRDKTEGGIINVRLRISKVRMVRRVQRLRTKLQVHAFRQVERAEDTQIGLEETRTTQSISSHGSETRTGLRRPRAIRGAIHSQHRVVEPWTSTRTTLCCGTHSSRDSYRRVELPRHLSAAAREQVRCTALYHIERQSTHPTHHTAYLETTKNDALPAFTSQPLTFAKGQIVNAIHLQVVLAIVARESTIPFLLRQILNPRTLIVISIVDRLGPRVRGAKQRIGPATSKQCLQRIIR